MLKSWFVYILGLTVLLYGGGPASAVELSTPDEPRIIFENSEFIEIEFGVPVPIGGEQGTTVLQTRINVPKSPASERDVVLILSGSLANDVEFTSGPPDGPLFKMEQKAAEFLAGQHKSAVIRWSKRGVFLPRRGASKEEKAQNVDFGLHGSSTLTARVADVQRVLDDVEKSVNPWLETRGFSKLNLHRLNIWGLSEGGATAALFALADQAQVKPRVSRLSLEGPATGSMIDIYYWQRVLFPVEQIWNNVGLKKDQDLTRDKWPKTKSEWSQFLKYPREGDFMPTTAGDIKGYYDTLGLDFTFENFAEGRSSISQEQFIEVLRRQTWEPLLRPVQNILARIPPELRPTAEMMHAWLRRGPEYFESKINAIIANAAPNEIFQRERRKFEDRQDFEKVSFAQFLHWSLLGDLGKNFFRHIRRAEVHIYHDQKDGNVPALYSVRLRRWINGIKNFFLYVVDIPGNFHRGVDLNRMSIDGAVGSTCGTVFR